MNIHARKDLLNNPGHHSVAAMSSRVIIVTDEHTEVKHLECDLFISDCHRSIGLNVSGHNQAAYDNTMYKLQTMIDHLTELKQGIQTGFEAVKK